MLYIDRETALQIIDNYAKTVTEDGKIIVDAVRDIVAVITPTADVEKVRHGRWIIKNSERDWKDKDTYRLSIECSECGKTHFLGTTKYQNEYDKEKLKALGNYADYSFCGKCGTYMDGTPQKEG